MIMSISFNIQRGQYMKRYLTTLEDEKTPRNVEEYIGAFTESLKVILKQNPVERIGQAVLLASKTALRLKFANPNLKEHEIANHLQRVARNIRLSTILKDLTPEEKGILNLVPDRNLNGFLKTPALTNKNLGKAKSAKAGKSASTRKRA